MMAPTVSIVIATRNRPEPLYQTLLSLSMGYHLPTEVIVIDSSDNELSRQVADQWWSFPLKYFHTDDKSAARQRNLGAQLAIGHYLVFIDDDIIAEPQFLRALVQPFLSDAHGDIGGVGGTNLSCSYTQPSRLNRCFLRLCIGDADESWEGRLVGPAVNFAPLNEPGTIKQVDWLASTAVAYVREAFFQELFCEEFEGYSFAEDVHLSARVARNWKLAVTGDACFVHLDMGQSTHRDWMALGKSMVLNRHKIMVEVLGRTSLAYHFRLFLFEIVYGAMVQVRSVLRKPASTWNVLQLFIGKLTGFWVLALRRFKSLEAGTVNTR